MFSGLKVPILCAAEDTKIILPSPVELAVSSREGRSSRVSRKWLKWFTLVEWVRRSLWKQKAGVTQLFTWIQHVITYLEMVFITIFSTACMHHKGDKVFLGRTKLHVALNVMTWKVLILTGLPVCLFGPSVLPLCKGGLEQPACIHKRKWSDLIKIWCNMSQDMVAVSPLTLSCPNFLLEIILTLCLGILSSHCVPTHLPQSHPFCWSSKGHWQKWQHEAESLMKHICAMGPKEFRQCLHNLSWDFQV